MAGFAGPNIVKDKLVSYLDAANTQSYPGSGTAWNDISGNGNNGTLINSPTFDSNNLTIARNGSNILGAASNLVVSVNSSAFTLVYVNATRGWIYKDKI